MTGRGLRRRRMAQAMLALAFVPAPMFALLLLAAPHFMEQQSFLVSNIPAIGVVAYVLGLLWMVRIYRADPEARPSPFRFRR